MGRPNVILTGAVVLAPVILGAEGYATYQALHRPARATAAPRIDPIESVTPEAPARPIPAPPAPPPPAPEPPAAPPQEVAAAEPAADVDPAVVALRQRALYERRAQVIHDADEQVFDLLKVPDAQRSAIRTINDQYAHTLAALAASGTGSDPQNTTVDTNAEQTRRAAIAGVLGPDQSHTFTFAERKAERHVRNHYRPDVVRGK